MRPKFDWISAELTILKTFLYTFCTMIAGIEIVLDLPYIQAIITGLISSLIASGTMSAQIISQYIDHRKKVRSK